MARISKGRALAVLLAGLLPGTLIAQDQELPALYVSVDCMKATAANYEGLEADTWKPMHQHLVDAGNRYSWALYRVMYGDRSKCDYYTVTTFLGEEQLNAAIDYEEAFKAAHPGKDVAQAMRQTWAAREQVSTELWTLIDQTELQPHRYAVVNRMYAEDPVAYESMESQVFKAGHQALIDGGYRAGWTVYALMSPLGSSIPYNYATVDFVNDLSPVPMAEAMMAANPDRDLDAMNRLLDLRDQVLSETWVLVTRTEAPAKE